MKKNDFIALVYEYEVNGTKVIDSCNEKVREAVIAAWAEVVNHLSEFSSEEADEKIGNYYLDTLYYIEYAEVNQEATDLTMSPEYALSFETEEEAENWIKENKEDWKYGTLTVC